MSQENVNARFQIGNVNNPQSFVRATIYNDQNEKSRIASTCGYHPETGSILVRITNTANLEELNPVFQALTESTYSDLLTQGKVQEYSDATHKWLRIPVDIIGGGMVSQQIVPMLSGSDNLSGHLEFKIESDLTAHDLKAFRDRGVTMLYAFLKSFRLQLTTNLSIEQLDAISNVVTEILGVPLAQFKSLYSRKYLTQTPEPDSL